MMTLTSKEHDVYNDRGRDLFAYHCETGIIHRRRRNGFDIVLRAIMYEVVTQRFRFLISTSIFVNIDINRMY